MVPQEDQITILLPPIWRHITQRKDGGLMIGDKTMDKKMTWFVDGKEVTPEEMRAMADAVENPKYDHDRLDGCRSELTCAGYIVRGSKYGRLILFEKPYHA